jgi:DNA-binding response OmpR family regulator
MSSERKILVIDDDDDLRQSLQEQLAIIDEFRVLTADTATSGIDLIKEEHPDMVVLDVGLPDMDGREVCRHAQAPLQEAHPHAHGEQRRCRSDPRI